MPVPGRCLQRGGDDALAIDRAGSQDAEVLQPLEVEPLEWPPGLRPRAHFWWRQHGAIDLKNLPILAIAHIFFRRAAASAAQKWKEGKYQGREGPEG